MVPLHRGHRESDYRAANDWDTQGSLAVTSVEQSSWPGSIQRSLHPCNPVTRWLVVTRRSRMFLPPCVLPAMRSVRRVKYHTAADGSLSEQFNRNTGFETSYGDLSWSYASLLTEPPNGRLAAHSVRRETHTH